MDLVTALEPEDELVCVVGAGGKTTTMFALASRLERAVVTATVRIPVFDREVASISRTDDPVTQVTASSNQFPLGLVAGREGDDRYLGYEPSTVTDLANAHDGPVLVKADGARMRGFKAPGENEPRIPRSTDLVVPVVSTHVVGKPLTGTWVHRPERIADLTDLSLGDEITGEAVGRVVAHEDGGLKGVPDGARVIPLLTKIDNQNHRRAAREIADAIHRYTESAPVPIPRVTLARFDAFETI